MLLDFFVCADSRLKWKEFHGHKSDCCGSKMSTVTIRRTSCFLLRVTFANAHNFYKRFLWAPYGKVSCFEPDSNKEVRLNELYNIRHLGNLSS